MNILILGATGFIGSHIAASLAADGHVVTGLGRATARMTARMPQVIWRRADISRMQKAIDWHKLLKNKDVVVNCAGALQEGLTDRVAQVQTGAQRALYEAAHQTSTKLIVQISAETEGPAAATAFLATKRAADLALANSGLPHVIIRPSLVIGRNAFGGTALLRALSAFPVAVPLVHGESPVATVTLGDTSHAVSLAIKGVIPSGSDLSLANEGATLRDLVRLHRAWLGLSPAPIIALPPLLAAPVSWVADALGWLGWRSPMRSTSMAVMRNGVTGGKRDKSEPPFALEHVSDFLAKTPSGVQDLWFARLYLLKPLVFFCLSAFWCASGLIPLLDPERAAGHLTLLLGHSAAVLTTDLASLLDILLGLMLAWRPRARTALIGMIATTLIYLAGSLLIEPALWLDPLGPMVKTLPALLLRVVSLAILDER